MRYATILLVFAAAVLSPFAAQTQHVRSLNPISGADRNAELLPFEDADLDDGSRQVLEAISAGEGPSPWTLPPRQLREQFDSFFGGYAIDDPGTATRESLMIPGPRGYIPIHIFRPLERQGAGPLPALIYYHGGGMMANSTDTYDSVLQLLSSGSGAAIISVDYRLAPENRFPAGIDDGYAALSWVSSHADEIGIDRERLAIGGDSAGGNMTAVISQMARNLNGPHLLYQVLVYPAVGTRGNSQSVDRFAEGYFFSREELAWIYAQYVGDAASFENPQVQPILAARFDGLPPALIVVPEFDIMRDDGEEYAALLSAAGVPTDLRRYEGTIHAFMNLGGAIPAACIAIEEIATKVGTALGLNDRPVDREFIRNACR